MLKVLGLLDLIAAVSLGLLSFGIWETFGLIAGFYLIIKGFIFLFTLDFVSLIDIFIGAFMLVMVYFNFHTLFALLLCVWLVQKGLVSLL